jgi:hypothetical protein
VHVSLNKEEEGKKTGHEKKKTEKRRRERKVSESTHQTKQPAQRPTRVGPHQWSYFAHDTEGISQVHPLGEKEIGEHDSDTTTLARHTVHQTARSVQARPLQKEDALLKMRGECTAFLVAQLQTEKLHPVVLIESGRPVVRCIDDASDSGLFLFFLESRE